MIMYVVWLCKKSTVHEERHVKKMSKSLELTVFCLSGPPSVDTAAWN